MYDSLKRAVIITISCSEHFAMCLPAAIICSHYCAGTAGDGTECTMEYALLSCTVILFSVTCS